MIHLRTLLIFAILLAAAQSFALESPALSPPAGSVRVGDMAPDFTLERLDSKTFSLAENIGEKPILLVFWSYFCFPCQADMPLIQEVYREIGPEQMTLLGISLDGHEYDKYVLPYIEENGINFPMAYDNSTEEFFETAEKYGVIGTPTTILIDADGRVRFMNLGRLEKSVLMTMVKGAVNKDFCPDITKPELQN